jgi:hypothetical protein
LYLLGKARIGWRHIAAQQAGTVILDRPGCHKWRLVTTQNVVCAVQGINAAPPTRFQSADLRTLSCSGSILNGPASICTFTRYSAAGSEGTRHEYWQVKPHPYSKLPVATTFPSGSVIVNAGLGGRAPLTTRLLQASPPTPTSDNASGSRSPRRYEAVTLGV